MIASAFYNNTGTFKISCTDNACFQTLLPVRNRRDWHALGQNLCIRVGKCKCFYCFILF